MNKKGFTIVELITVMALLTIIILIAYPNFSSLSEKAKDKYDYTTEILLRNAAKIYVNNNTDEINSALETQEKVCIPIGKLMAYEYLASDISDLKGNKLKSNSCVNVSKKIEDEKTSYIYETSTDDTVPNGIDYLPPVIRMTESESNKDIKCSTIMYLPFNSVEEAYQNFIQNCIVYAVDDKDSNIYNIDSTITLGTNKVLLEYNTYDSSNNKAIPLNIQLIKQ